VILGLSQKSVFIIANDRHCEWEYFSNKQTEMTCLRVPMDYVEAGAGEISTTACTTRIEIAPEAGHET
jgi:hypothetical protein